MALSEASDRKSLERMYSFWKMEEKLSSISSDDRIHEQSILTRKYVHGVTKFSSHMCLLLDGILVAARSKAWVCGRSLAGIVGSNPAGDMDVCLL